MTVSSRQPHNKLIYNKNSLLFDKEQFVLIDKKGNKAPDKLHHDCECNLCHKLYDTFILKEKKKKHPWLCKSCAITKEWQSNEYRKKLLIPHKIATSTEKFRIHCSKQSKLNWSNSSIRKKMTNRTLDDRKCAAQKGRKTYLKNIEKGLTKSRGAAHGKRELYKGQYFRSTYETRFARVLDEHNINWQYEPRGWVVQNKKAYVPDFYINDYDLWVEIKGWWRDDAREKFISFINEYDDLNIALIMSDELKLLENKVITIETIVNNTRIREECL